MASQGTQQMSGDMQQHLEECIRLCFETAKVCEQCGAECVRMDMAGMARCIELCRDCADICLLDARFMSRNSQFHFQTCAVCADVCEACATECERMAGSHEGAMGELMRRCAEACRRCAESCRQMASMAA